jgi:dihydrofolate reductase
MDINMIVAMTQNRVIGHNGTLIWDMKEDMKVFREKTRGATVIMGKTTWDSLPEQFRPLPGRANIVLDWEKYELPGAIICNSIEESIAKAKELGKTTFCIGGASIYKAFLPYTNILHISWVKKEHEGNVVFPEFNLDEWNEVESTEYEEFIHKKYERKNKIQL